MFIFKYAFGDGLFICLSSADVKIEGSHTSTPPIFLHGVWRTVFYVYSFICLFIYQSVCLFVYWSVHPSIHLMICIFIYLYIS
jgi:hypothetical protein